MSEEGKKRLRDLAKQVKEQVDQKGAPQLNQRGLDLVAELAQELGGPDAMPGLKVWRDTPAKFRLTRSPRNAEIAVEWERDIGALAVAWEKHGSPRAMVRYVWDQALGKWRKLDGGGEIWEDIAALLVETLYPEAAKK